MEWQRQWEELTRQEEWNVGVVEAPIAAFLDPGFRPEVRWLPVEAGTYLADPFVRPRGDWDAIFCEEWNARTGVGRLVLVDVAGRRQPLRGFPDGVHFSYPYLLEEAGGIFCVPESCETGSVRLYRCVRWPVEWEFEATLLPEVAGVDATVFRHEGRWWLAATDLDGEPEEDLCLWHAPAPRGPWTAHRKNPVKRDAGSARPAGTPFVHNGALYRPAQDNRRSYGAGIALNRVMTLTPDEFAEETVVRLTPRPSWRWRDGWHTLTAAGEATLIDAKRTGFIPRAFTRVVGRKLDRLRRRAKP